MRLALAQIERETFDLVLTDLRLDDFDGMDVLAAARRRSPETVGIVLTGYASLESVKRSQITIRPASTFGLITCSICCARDANISANSARAASPCVRESSKILRLSDSDTDLAACCSESCR